MFGWNLLRYVTLRTNIPPFLTKSEILGYKKDRSRSKEISFLLHMFFSTKYQQYKHKKDDAEKAKHVIIVSRLPKLVLYHLRQVFICGIFSLIMQN